MPEPEDLRSRDGVLKVDLTIRNSAQADGSTRYCYIDGNGNQSPNLEVKARRSSYTAFEERVDGSRQRGRARKP